MFNQNLPNRLVNYQDKKNIIDDVVSTILNSIGISSLMVDDSPPTQLLIDEITAFNKTKTPSIRFKILRDPMHRGICSANPTDSIPIASFLHQADIIGDAIAIVHEGYAHTPSQIDEFVSRSLPNSPTCLLLSTPTEFYGGCIVSTDGNYSVLLLSQTSPRILQKTLALEELKKKIRTKTQVTMIYLLN